MNKCTLGLYEKALPDWLTWEEKLRAAKEAGFDGIEISIDETDARLSRLEWTKEQRIELLTLTREMGVYINSMCLSGHRKYPMGSPDPKVRARSMEIMKKAIELAHDLGVRVIQLAGYDVYYEPSTIQTRYCFEQNLKLAAEMAAAKGIRLGFETMETDFMNTTSKAMEYVRIVNSPYLNVYPDVGNITNGTTDVLGDLKTGAGWICAAHLKETKEGIFRNMMFGEGRVNFDAVIPVLREMGVRMFTAEFWYQGEEDYRVNLKRAHDFLRPYLN